MYFYALDGDDIGAKLEEFIFRDNENGLIDFHVNFSEFLCRTRQRCEALGITTIFCVGDSYIGKSSRLVDISSLNLHKGKLTFSIGIGSSMSNAALALKMAKALGKKQIVKI